MKLRCNARPPDSKVYALLAASHCFIRIIHVFFQESKQKSLVAFILCSTMVAGNANDISNQVGGWRYLAYYIWNTWLNCNKSPLYSWVRVHSQFLVQGECQHDTVERVLEWESDGRATSSLPWPSAFAVLNLHFLFLGSEGDWTRDD